MNKTSVRVINNGVESTGSAILSIGVPQEVIFSVSTDTYIVASNRGYPVGWVANEYDDKTDDHIKELKVMQVLHEYDI